jgi:hypothetical protein
VYQQNARTMLDVYNPQNEIFYLLV